MPQSTKRNDKMSDDELSLILGSLENDSVSYNSEFMAENEELLKRYNQEPYGDEEEGFSQVIATDVSDIVEADMTSMVRVFLGSGDVMVFEPMTDDPADIEEAKIKTKYINHLILKRPGQYKVIHDFLKDAEIQKMGVLYYYMDTVKDTREVKYKDLDEVELTLFMDELKSKDKSITKVEITQKDEIEIDGGADGQEVSRRFDVWLRITTEYQDIKIVNIATEDFLLSRNAATVDDAQMVGHVSYPTRSELVASGMSEEEVFKFSTSTPASTDASNNNSNTGSAQSQNMKAIRFRDEGGNLIDGAAFGEWCSQTVRMVTMFAKVDVDRDGIAERRRFVKIGDSIVENEPYDHVPYAVTSCIIEPHKAIGNGRASLVIKDQSVNTALSRAMLDNTYDSTRPRSLLGDGVNIDDFLDHRSDGVVRMNKGSGQKPSDAIFPLLTPYIGDKALMTIQYFDAQQSARTGSMLDSQGLEADQLQRETATRFSGMEQAREAKIELVARNHAETGFRKLYEGVTWTVNRYQDKEQQVRVAGKAIKVNPSDWKFPSLAVSQVGLGAGSGQKSVQQMTGILQIQGQLKAQGSLLVDDKKTYNALDKMVQGLGLARTGDYFNNPEVPMDMLFAQYQQLVAALQQSQQMLDQAAQANPLAEAETIKAQASLINAQQKSQVELIKADAQKEIKQMEMIQDTAKFEAEQVYDYTKLEIENGTDIPGQGMGQ